MKSMSAFVPTILNRKANSIPKLPDRMIFNSHGMNAISSKAKAEPQVRQKRSPKR